MTQQDEHLGNVRRVVEYVLSLEASVPHAALVLEDAYVTLACGLSRGLDAAAIRQYVRELLAPKLS